MMSLLGKQAIAIQILFIDVRNIFLGKLYTKCFGVTILRPFSKKSKLSISLD